MTGLVIVVLIGLLGGIAGGLQGPLASMMAKDVGVMGSVFIIHLVGTVCAGLLLLVPGTGSLATWHSVPWYALSGGVLGVILVGALSLCIPRIGAVAAITLIIGGQLIVSAWLDHFGIIVDSMRSFDPTRAFGLVVVFLGTWLVVR